MENVDTDPESTPLNTCRASTSNKRRKRRIGWTAVFLAIVAGLSAASIAIGAIPLSERRALRDLYASTNGNGWLVKDNWNGTVGTECTWRGVTCDSSETHVVELVIKRKNMVGPIPPNLFTGLPGLRRASLQGNKLTGRIPSFTGASELVWLDLSDNQLSGMIPSLDDLSEIQFFAVSGNQLTGGLPSLSSMTKLLGLKVDGNKLTGPLPSWPGERAPYQGGTVLCDGRGQGNQFKPLSDANWDYATKVTPWHSRCVAPRDVVFANGFD